MLLIASGALAADDDYSPAQKLLFASPHLESISAPTTLHYDFQRSGSRPGAFEDRVDMIVTQVLPDGRKNLAFHFLSGKREKPFQPIEGFRGNPLIMLFLQRDVEEMESALGGSQVYFRNRIRYSFSDRAEIEQVQMEIDGRSLTVTRITVRPYVGDEMGDRMGDQEHKVYEITLSPDLPGGVYRLRSLVPASSGAEPLVEEVMTFRSAEN